MERKLVANWLVPDDEVWVSPATWDSPFGCGLRKVAPSASANSAMDAILRASIAVVDSRFDAENLNRTLDVLQALLAKQHHSAERWQKLQSRKEHIMGAAKTFREWWNAQGPIDHKMDRRSAEIAWNAAQNAMEIAPSASANKQMAAALWRELNHSCPALVPLKTDWVAVTEKRLNSAVTKVLGL